MLIIVGTTSTLKLSAAQAAFQYATIEGVKTASGVPEQPLEEQTEQGAYNRLREAKRLKPDADMYVGIENGIFFEHGNYVDKAVIVLENKAGEQHVEYSLGVVFPTSLFFKAKRQGFDNITVGQVMFDAGLVQKKDDPHADLGDKISRLVLLTDTMTEAFNQLERQSKSSLGM